MKAKEGVIDLLNKILTNELTAINQYFVHAKMCDNWGYARLAHKIHHFSIDEMKDADKTIAHILYLEGIPNMQRLGTVHVGETAQEQLKLALKQEQDAVKLFREAITHCAKVEDYTTRHLLEEMVVDEEHHIDWLETQLETIEQIGLENYLGQQIKKDS